MLLLLSVEIFLPFFKELVVLYVPITNGGVLKFMKINELSYLRKLLTDKEIAPSYSHSVVTDTYKDKNTILSVTAARSLDQKNAGGKSEVSEALSINYFEKLIDAKDIILEMEVEYWIDYSMVDYICSVGENRIGVSVTRAMGHSKQPGIKKIILNEAMFSDEDAENLLKRKLYGLIVSRNSVMEKHSFFRSVLHVWCQSQRIADLLRSKFESYDLNDFGLDIKGSVILLLTVCNNENIYYNTRDGLCI